MVDIVIPNKFNIDIKRQAVVCVIYLVVLHISFLAMEEPLAKKRRLNKIQNASQFDIVFFDCWENDELHIDDSKFKYDSLHEETDEIQQELSDSENEMFNELYCSEQKKKHRAKKKRVMKDCIRLMKTCCNKISWNQQDRKLLIECLKLCLQKWGLETFEHCIVKQAKRLKREGAWGALKELCHQIIECNIVVKSFIDWKSYLPYLFHKKDPSTFSKKEWVKWMNSVLIHLSQAVSKRALKENLIFCDGQQNNPTYYVWIKGHFKKFASNSIETAIIRPVIDHLIPYLCETYLKQKLKKEKVEYYERQVGHKNQWAKVIWDKLKHDIPVKNLIDFNRNQYLFCDKACKTYSLLFWHKSGYVLPINGNPRHCITRVVETVYKQHAKPTKTVVVSLRALSNNDPEILKVIMKYLSAGINNRADKCILVLESDPDSGKTSVTNLLRCTLGGTIVVEVDEKVFHTSAGKDSHDALICHALKRDASVVIVKDFHSRSGDLKHCVNAALWKKIVGEDTITKRPIFGEPVEYNCLFNLVLHTNEKKMFLTTLEAVKDKVLWVKIKSKFVSNISNHDLANLRFVKRSTVLTSWHEDVASKEYFLHLLVNAAASVVHDNDWYAKHKLPQWIVQHSFGAHLTSKNASISYTNTYLKQYIHQNLVLKKDVPDFSVSNKPKNTVSLKTISDFIIDKHYKHKKLDSECYAMIYKEYSQYIRAYIMEYVTCVTVTYKRQRVYYLMEKPLDQLPDANM